MTRRIEVKTTAFTWVCIGTLLAACGTAGDGSGDQGEDGQAETAQNDGGEESTQVELRFAHSVTVPGTVWEEMSTSWIPERFEEATDGAVTVQVIRDAIDSDALLDATSGRSADAGNLILNYVAGTHSEWGVFGLPGLMTHEHEADMHGLFTDVIQPNLAEMTEERWGLTPLVVSAFPENRWWTVGHKLESMDDFQGLQIRTNSPETTELAQALGAAPIGTEFAELYPALERGMVEAATSSTVPIHGSALYEVLDYVHFLPGGISTYAVFIDQDSLESLPAEVQTALLDEAAMIQEEVWDMELEWQEDRLSAMQDEGVEVVEVSDDFYNEVLEVAQAEVWESWRDNAGEDAAQLLDDIREYLGEQ